MGRDYYGILGVDKKASQDGPFFQTKKGVTTRVLWWKKLTSAFRELDKNLGKIIHFRIREEETNRFEDLSCSRLFHK